jgi:site-specific DNA-cytosine methylase
MNLWRIGNNNFYMLHTMKAATELKVLELFKGTGSVTKALHKLKMNSIVTLDVDPKFEPDICVDVLKWNYKRDFPEKYFDVIWASPPCTEYSRAKTIGVRDLRLADSLVKRTIKIIKYFKPKVWFIENPQTGMLKDRSFMRGVPFYDVTYCMYGFKYRKPTRIWTNLQGFKPKFCHFDCKQIVDGRHIKRIGNGLSDGNLIMSTRQQYEIPFKLLKNMFDTWKNQ